MTNDSLLDRLIQRCSDKKAEHIISYDVHGRSVITDTIVLLSASNSIHLKALAQDLSEEAPNIVGDSPDYYAIPKVTGAPDSGWIVVDFNSAVFHILVAEMRELFKLEDVFQASANSVIHY